MVAIFEKKGSLLTKLVKNVDRVVLYVLTNKFETHLAENSRINQQQQQRK